MVHTSGVHTNHNVLIVSHTSSTLKTINSFWRRPPPPPRVQLEALRLADSFGEGLAHEGQGVDVLAPGMPEIPLGLP